MLAIVFWVAVGCIVHTYVLYPLLLIALDAVAQARGAWGYLGGNERRRRPAQLGLPQVSVLIAAYNETACIGLLGMTPRRARALADAAAHFVEMNAALLVGFVKYSRGTQGQIWKRTDRPARAA